MKIHRENTDKVDRIWRDNPFAKKWKAKGDAYDAVRGLNSKVEALKSKKK